MNSTTETLYELPNGYDDEESPFYVRPEHRAQYQRIEVTQRELAQYLSWERAAATRTEDLALWERNRAEMEATRSPENYATWLRRHTDDEGNPRLTHVGEMNGATERGPGGTKILTQAQTAHAAHLARRAAAVKALQQEESNRRLRDEQRRKNTCGICGTLTKPVMRGMNTVPSLVKIAAAKPNDDPARACKDCAALIKSARSAAAEVPVGGSRADVVSAWLGMPITDQFSKPARRRIGRR